MVLTALVKLFPLLATPPPLPTARGARVRPEGVRCRLPAAWLLLMSALTLALYVLLLAAAAAFSRFLALGDLVCSEPLEGVRATCRCDSVTDSVLVSGQPVLLVGQGGDSMTTEMEG